LKAHYASLREELVARGHTFTSETDTEVIPHLVESYRHEGLSPEEAFRAAIDRLEGRFAVVMIVADRADVFAARNGSPLVLGVGDDRRFLASDVPSFLEHTDRVVYLEDGLGGDADDGVHRERHRDPDETGSSNWSHKRAGDAGHRSISSVREGECGKRVRLHRWYEADATGLDPVEEADTQ